MMVGPALGPVAEEPAADRPLSLRRNFSWTLAGNVVYAACQWGMLVALAKLVSPEGVGQFALGLAITAPVFMLTNLQLRAVQATDSRGEYVFGDYLGLRLVLSAGAIVVVVAIALVAGYPRPTAAVIAAIGCAKAFESISDAFYGLLQQRERMDRIAVSMMIKGPCSLAALVIAVALTRSVPWGAAALAATWAIVLGAYDVRAGSAVLAAKRHAPSTPGSRAVVAESGCPRWDAATMMRLARLALPLGVVMALVSLNGNIPRYFIEHLGGEGELGIYSALAYLMVAGGLVVNALGQAATPRLAKHFSDGDRASFRSLLLRLIVVGLALGLIGLAVALLAGREILTLLYRTEYARRLDVLVALMIAAAVGYVGSFLGYGMTAARQFKVQAPLFATAGVCTAAACALLVPRSGILGAAYASIVTAVVALLGGGAVTARALRKLP